MSSNVVEQFLDACRKLDQTQIKSCITQIANNTPGALQQGVDLSGIDWAKVLNQACLPPGMLGTVQKLLEQSPDVFTLDMKNDAMSLIHYGENSLWFVALLLEHGAGQERRMVRGWIKSFKDHRSIELLQKKCRELTGNRQDATVMQWTLHDMLGNNLNTKQAIFDHGILTGAENHIDGIKTPFYYAAFMGLTHELAAEFPLDNTPNREEELNAALEVACSNGHVEVVKFLLDRGIDINKPVGKGSPLWIACNSGQTEVARELLARGANVNYASTESGFTPLMLAALSGNEILLALIMDKRSDFTLKTVRVTDYKHTNRHDARLDDRFSAIHLACQKGHANIVKMINQHRYSPLVPDFARTALGYTPLAVAIEYEQEAVINELLSQNDPDPNGIAFVAACECGNVPVIRALAQQYQARPSIVDLNLKTADAPMRPEIEALIRGSDNRPTFPIQPIALDDATPAFLAACWRQDLTTAKRLLNQCNALEIHFVPVLETACSEGHLEVVKWLLGKKHQADLNELLIRTCRSRSGNAHHLVAQVLIKAGAKVNYRDHAKDQSPLELATCTSDRLELLKVLLATNPDFSTETWAIRAALRSDVLTPVLFNYPHYTNKERSKLLIMACKQLDYKGFDEAEYPSIVRRVGQATQLLVYLGVDPKAKTKALELTKKHQSIHDVLEPPKAADRKKPAANPQREDMEEADIHHEPLRPSTAGSGVAATKATTTQRRALIPEDAPIRKLGATPSVKYLNYVEKKAKKFEHSKFPRGIEKHRQLVFVIDKLRSALDANSTLTPEVLLTTPLTDPTTQETITLDSALNFRRYLTASKTARQVKQETMPSELKKLADEFFTKLARRLKADKTGKYAALKPFLEDRPAFNSVEDLCRYKGTNRGEDSQNLLQVLKMLSAFKAFAKKFHLADHLDETEIQSILDGAINSNLAP